MKEDRRLKQISTGEVESALSEALKKLTGSRYGATISELTFGTSQEDLLNDKCQFKAIVKLSPVREYPEDIAESFLQEMDSSRAKNRARPNRAKSAGLVRTK